MSTSETEVTLFVKATPAAHRRLSILAAKFGIPKGELYSHAIDWASRQKKFRDLMEKVYEERT